MWTELGIGVGIVAGRNIIGFLINSLRDGKIQSYEWKQGLVSLGVILGISIGLYLGLPEESFIEVSGLVAGGDMALSELKKVFKK